MLAAEYFYNRVKFTQKNCNFAKCTKVLLSAFTSTLK